jgi:proteasome lid subunit RPN8/RPN11
MQPSGGFRRLHPSPNGSAEFENIRNVDIEADKKAPRFKPSKEQLDILIAAYEDNKWVGTLHSHKATKRTPPATVRRDAVFPVPLCRRDAVT